MLADLLTLGARRGHATPVRPRVHISGKAVFARLICAAPADKNKSGRAPEPARRQRLHASFTAKLRLSFTANEAARGAGSHAETFMLRAFYAENFYAETCERVNNSTDSYSSHPAHDGLAMRPATMIH